MNDMASDFENAQEHLQSARKALRAVESLARYDDVDDMVKIANLHLAVVTATANLLAGSAALLTASTSAKMSESLRQSSLNQKESMAAMVDAIHRQLGDDTGLGGL